MERVVIFSPSLQASSHSSLVEHGGEAGRRGHVSFTFVAGECDTFRPRSSYGPAMKTAPNGLSSAPCSVTHLRQNIPVRATAPRMQKRAFRRAALRGAYALLAAVSVVIVILDCCKRRDAAAAASPAATSTPRHYVPLPITPLAESPFLKKSSPRGIAAASPSDEAQMEGRRRSLAEDGNRS